MSKPNLISPLLFHLSSLCSGLSVVPVCCVIDVQSVYTAAYEFWPHAMAVSVFICNKGFCCIFIENTESMVKKEMMDFFYRHP